MIRFLFSFKGRINRLQYWLYTIGVISFYFLVGGIIIAIVAVGNIAELDKRYTDILGILGLMFTYTMIAIAAKRLHDTDRSGLNILWELVPCIGIFYLLIVCGFLKGTPHKNRYGEPPG